MASYTLEITRLDEEDADEDGWVEVVAVESVGGSDPEGVTVGYTKPVEGTEGAGSTWTDAREPEGQVRRFLKIEYAMLALASFHYGAPDQRF